MKFYRVYDLEYNGYVVVRAKNKNEALTVGSQYNTGKRQDASVTTEYDYKHNLFSI